LDVDALDRAPVAGGIIYADRARITGTGVDREVEDVVAERLIAPAVVGVAGFPVRRHHNHRPRLGGVDKPGTLVFQPDRRSTAPLKREMSLPLSGFVLCEEAVAYVVDAVWKEHRPPGADAIADRALNRGGIVLVVVGPCFVRRQRHVDNRVGGKVIDLCQRRTCYEWHRQKGQAIHDRAQGRFQPAGRASA